MCEHGWYFQILGLLTSRWVTNNFIWSRVEFLGVTNRNCEVCTEHICYMDSDWLSSSAYHAMCAATSRVYIAYFYLVTPKFLFKFQSKYSCILHFNEKNIYFINNTLKICTDNIQSLDTIFYL